MISTVIINNARTVAEQVYQAIAKEGGITPAVDLKVARDRAIREVAKSMAMTEQQVRDNLDHFTKAISDDALQAATAEYLNANFQASAEAARRAIKQSNETVLNARMVLADAEAAQGNYHQSLSECEYASAALSASIDCEVAYKVRKRLALAQFLNEKYAEADHVLIQLEEQTQGCSKLNDRDRLSLSNMHAVVWIEMGRYDEAIAMLKATVQQGRRQYGSQDWDLASWINNLGAAMYARGKMNEAKSCFIEAISIGERNGIANKQEVAKWVNNYASILQEEGKLSFAEAEKQYLHAKALDEECLPLSHPDRSNVLNNLASLYCDMGKFEDAKMAAFDALDAIRNAMAKNSQMEARSRFWLAKAHHGLGEEPEAKNAINMSLDIATKAFDRDNEFVARVKRLQIEIVGTQ